MEERRIWDDLAPNVKTLFRKFLENAYTGGDGNRIIIVDEDGNPVTSLGGGGGGAGGGSIVYTNAAFDFTATPGPGARTITITGLPYTLEAKHVIGGSIKRKTVAGAITDVKTTNVLVSGGVVTLSDADDTFATGDELYMTLIGPDKWYDQPQDAAKVIVENRLHYTDIEHIVDASDGTAAYPYYSAPIPAAGYKFAMFHFTGSSAVAGVAFRIYVTGNPNAAIPADGDAAPSLDWDDASIDIMGVTGTTLDGESDTFFVDGPSMPHQYIVQYTPDTGTNETDIFIRKYS